MSTVTICVMHHEHFQQKKENCIKTSIRGSPDKNSSAYFHAMNVKDWNQGALISAGII